MTKLKDLFEEKSSYLSESIKLTNYSVYIPIIIILITIIFLIIAIFKKNKIIYISLIVLIFLDLFSMGHFYEVNKQSDYIYKDLDNSKELSFLSNKNEIFRIYPVKTSIDGYALSGNKNIHLKISSIAGYVPFILRDYHYITGISDSSRARENYLDLLKNNNILSMLNTKYIIIPKPEEPENFLKNIRKIYYQELYSKENVLKIIKLKNFKITPGLKVESSNNNDLKIIELPIVKNIEKIIVSFDIKKIDNNAYEKIYIYLFCEEGKKIIDKLEINEKIGNNYTNVSKILINNKSIKGAKYIKICTRAKIMMKNLKVGKINEYNYYSIAYSDADTIILENLNYNPRFYFVDEIMEKNNLEEVKNVLWEKNVVWEQDRFDPQKIALVENVDFKQKKFDVVNSEIKIISYKNNRIELETYTNNYGFLVFSNNYYPGWKAYIDNNQTKIYKTNKILQGILIPKGRHKVIFKYIPSYFYLGLILSFITIQGVIILILSLFYKKNS